MRFLQAIMGENSEKRARRSYDTRSRHRTRPGLEAVESRTLLSTLIVTNTNDSGAGSLRQAITDAASGGTIEFQSGVSGTISLSSTLDINKPLTIDGPGAAALTIDGNNATQIFNIDDGNPATFLPVSISGLTLAHGRSSGTGGAIYTRENLTLTGDTLTGNSANGGGAIHNDGTLTVSFSTLSGNTAIAAGGGIFNGRALIISSSTLVGNIAGSNAGGGIYSNNYSSGPLTVINSTFFGNSAPHSDGGGIFAINPLTVISSTFSGNSANGGGGISAPTSPWTCQNTIIAGNRAMVGPDVYLPYNPPVTSLGHNLVGVTDGSSGWTGTDLTGTSAAPLDPKLGPLANNGGPTQTMALLPGSPAIDAGDNSLAVDAQGNPLTTDQRGPGFPRIVNGTVDIGAFESQTVSTSTFDTLAGPTIIYGTATTTLSGHIVAGAHIPTGGVAITLNGVTQSAAIDPASGNFSSVFTTSGLGVSSSPYAITYSYAGDGVSTEASATKTLTVTPAPLTITADNLTKLAGEANPTFTVSYSGFVLGQGPGVLGSSLTFNTTATASSPPGTYAITPGGLTSDNYAITFVSGTLTVLSYAQATNNLVAQVNGAGLPQGTQNSLNSQLQAAIDSFNRGQTTAGVNQLSAFINHVSAQSGKQIDAALADALIAYAQRIINAVG